MSVDKVLLEVLNNRFTGIVEEMGYVIHRAAFTTFVKETWDFDSALLTPEGDVFVYPRNIGVTNMLAIDMKPAIDCFAKYEPGDIVLMNDPFHSRGMCTHFPDLMAFKPIFHDGRIVCFAWCFLHSSDVGGIVPGSITPRASDRFQEGFSMPPVKLYKAGRLDEEIKRVILSNCRIPEQNWGDIRALMAALSIAERRMTDVVAQYGAAQVDDVMHGLIDYGEKRAREVFAAVPDGEYTFSDYLEGDGFGKYHVRIKVRLVVKGSDVLMDFTGTDPQVPAAFNLPTFGAMNQFLVLGIVNFLRTSDPHLPFNRGIVRPVVVIVPEGTVLNPGRYAATGVRYTTALRISDVVMGALSKAVPEKIPAAGSGQMGILTLSDLEAKTGMYEVHVLEPLQGGSGGRPGMDGIDGVNFSGGALRNAPIEALELDAPILVSRYMLSDKVAAGRYRGGAGVVFEFQTLSPHAMVSSRGWDRFLIRPWGRFGGHPGPLGETVVFRPGERPRKIPKIDSLTLQKGEVVRITSPGGGGYGDPLQRDPQLVLHDSVQGFVTRRQAEQDYGVVLKSAGVDVAATKKTRDAMVSRRRDLGEFCYGSERESYEKTLPASFQDRVLALLADQPAANRFYLRNLAYDAVSARKLDPLDARAVKAFVGELTRGATAPSLRKPTAATRVRRRVAPAR
jgi:N-methylhydantoinase B